MSKDNIIDKLIDNIVIFNHLYRMMGVLTEREWKECLDRQIKAIDFIKDLEVQE